MKFHRRHRTQIGTHPTKSLAIARSDSSCSFDNSQPSTQTKQTSLENMRNLRQFFPFVPFILGVSESFVPIPSQRSSSETNLIRHTAPSPLAPATGSGSNANYISFSADTGFLVSPSAFNAVLDRFELRKRIGILLNNGLDGK